MAYKPTLLAVIEGGTGLASTTANQLLYSSATSTIAGLASANNAILATNGSGVPSITTASGNWLNTTRCAFFACNNTSPQNVTGDGTVYDVVLDVELFDQGSNFASNTFTAPVTGKYQFNCGVLGQSLVGTMQPQVNIVTTSQTYIWGNYGTTVTGNLPIGFSILVAMSAGDTAKLQFQVSGGTKVVDIYSATADPRTFLSGFLVC